MFIFLELIFSVQIQILRIETGIVIYLITFKSILIGTVQYEDPRTTKIVVVLEYYHSIVIFNNQTTKKYILIIIQYNGNNELDNYSSYYTTSRQYNFKITTSYSILCIDYYYNYK